jgi:hypothetical protein
VSPPTIAKRGCLIRPNLSFATIVRRCQGLEETRIFRSKFLQRFQGFAQELQAEIDSELMETLHECELHDWYGGPSVLWILKPWLARNRNAFSSVRISLFAASPRDSKWEPALLWNQ